MRAFKMIILVLLICLPTAVQSAPLHYALSIEVDTKGRTIAGTALITVDAQKEISLFVQHLKNVTVNGNPASRSIDGALSLSLQKNTEIVIRYDASFQNSTTNFFDQNNVFLNELWYPRLDTLARYSLSVTLPKDFLATSEADAITVTEHGKSKTFRFQFDHPLDTLHLAASNQYVLKTEYHNRIAIEAYFFKEDVHLADTYIAHSKKYLNMYESMLTPYPYRRFAIVENILPTGYSMPTFTLLGRQVIRLPFIVNTSLGHEILHQWFGNSVYIDFSQGNWTEGLTSYLSDHHYAALKGEGVAYRKQIMVDYNAYVNENNAISLHDFMSRQNKALSAIGYGKVAMVFHGLKERFGEEAFFSALRYFIRQNSFREASWSDIILAFEEITDEKLQETISVLLERKDIPQLKVIDPELRVDKGKLNLSFTVIQKEDPYRLRLPITIYSERTKAQRHVDITSEKETITVVLDHMPKKVVIDEEYALMRLLTPEEMPPVLAAIMGEEKIIAAVSDENKALYESLFDGLGDMDITYLNPTAITFDQIKTNSLLIADYENSLVNRLFGKQSGPKHGVCLKVLKNPYNEEEHIVLCHAESELEIQAAQHKLSHYGKYSDLAFNNGKNIKKTIAKTENGMVAYSRPTARAVAINKTESLKDIFPELADKRVIYVGEHHTNFAHHMNQLQIIKTLHETGHKIAVGMEMFQRPCQQAIDDYLSGKIDERTFLERSDYFSKWRYDYNLYKPILDYIKQEKIPLIALNIDGDITRAVACTGIHSLSDEAKAQLPSESDFSDEHYREDLRIIFSQHPEPDFNNNFDFFLQAQILWDETMAQTAHQFLEQHPDRKLVILAGNGHVRHKYGIPLRLYRRSQEPFTVISQDDEVEEGIADYVLLTSGLKGRLSPRLGILIEEDEQGLIIKGVNDKTPAKKAGLQEGDRIIRFGEQEITSLGDLKYGLFYSEYGSTVMIHIIRDNETIEKKIELFRFHPQMN
jgi:aminopeptidase N